MEKPQVHSDIYQIVVGGRKCPPYKTGSKGLKTFGENLMGLKIFGEILRVLKLLVENLGDLKTLGSSRENAPGWYS